MVEINCQPQPQIRIQLGQEWDRWATVRPNSVEYGMQKKICFNKASVLTQSSLTWRTLQLSMRKGEASSLRDLVPTQLSSEFANGQFAISALHTGRTAYVVSKGGRKLPNLSTVNQQYNGSNIKFNAANGYTDLASMPALSSFPTQLYNSGQLIEVSRYAARHDGVETRTRMRQSQKATLSNGKVAYYLKQFTQNGETQGWCFFEDEAAQYSRFICVNRAGSSSSALKILEAIVVKPISSLK